MGMRPHSVIGFHYAVDSTDVMYQVRRNPWCCAFENFANRSAYAESSLGFRFFSFALSNMNAEDPATVGFL